MVLPLNVENNWASSGLVIGRQAQIMPSDCSIVVQADRVTILKVMS